MSRHPPVPLALGGQRGWAHDEGYAHTSFHTWDALDVGSRFGSRKVHVMLPRNGRGGPYPTLYLHDGDAVFWPGGAVGKSWGVGWTIDELLEARRIKPIIVVAIHPVVRDAEYTHVDWAHGRRPFGRLQEHADYLANEVKSFIDAHYPTRPEAKYTAVAGSSHGGLAAFYTAMAWPERFGLAAALSPSFFSGLDSLVSGPSGAPLAGSPLLQMADSTLRDAARRPRLWLSWGARRDGGAHNAVTEALAARRAEEMIGLLRDTYGYRARSFDEDGPRDAELWRWVDPVGGHDEAAWSWQLRLALQAFFPAN